MKSKNNTNIILYIVFSSFSFTIIIWCLYFKLTLISNAEGQVIPVGEVKTIQHLEGGIIDQILLKKVNIVKKINH